MADENPFYLVLKKAAELRKEKCEAVLKELEKVVQAINALCKEGYESRLEYAGVSHEGYTERHVIVGTKREIWSGYGSSPMTLFTARIHYTDGYPVKLLNICGEDFSLTYDCEDQQRLEQSIIQILQRPYVSIYLASVFKKRRKTRTPALNA